MTAGFAAKQQTVSFEVIRKTDVSTEVEFLNLVRKQWLIKPQIASVGSCCLVGVINEGVLYIANAGDSRAVLGRVERGGRDMKAVQLSSEHNASFQDVRDELRELHPDDPRIVVLKHNVWRVKGIIQVFCSAELCKIDYVVELRCKFGLQDYLMFDHLLLRAPFVQSSMILDF